MSHVKLIAPEPSREAPTAPALQYERGKNPSGLHPLGRAVLVLPIPMEVKPVRIVLPEGVSQRALLLDTEAYVVEMGPDCGATGDPADLGKRCSVGDRVILARMAGAHRVGKDGQTYRFVNHRDIYARVDEE